MSNSLDELYFKQVKSSYAIVFLFYFLDIHLHPYQIEGVNWMIHCYETGHGCILGDEMGLGKTCQVFVFLYEMYDFLIVKRKMNVIVCDT